MFYYNFSELEKEFARAFGGNKIFTVLPKLEAEDYVEEDSFEENDILITVIPENKPRFAFFLQHILDIRGKEVFIGRIYTDHEVIIPEEYIEIYAVAESTALMMIKNKEDLIPDEIQDEFFLDIDLLLERNAVMIECEETDPQVMYSVNWG